MAVRDGWYIWKVIKSYSSYSLRQTNKGRAVIASFMSGLSISVCAMKTKLIVEILFFISP